MPSSDYTSAGGGALKLKGAGIDKKKKKKKPKPDSTSAAADSSTSTKSSSQPATTKPDSKSPTPTRSLSPTLAEHKIKASGGRQKTEAELRYEEARRKRLDERLRREGVKTHKERVEELNRYLSELSEHHDMPKIGPG